jgi:putative component of membrane protein insertase Oxa1/YidC/SpoIIIJ protein YidD
MFVSKKKLIRYNPVNLAFGGLLYFYQQVVSPQISAECPYEISCSNFGKASIQRFCFVKGIALTAGRLMRCCKVAAVDIHPLYIDEKGKIMDDPNQYTLK